MKKDRVQIILLASSKTKTPLSKEKMKQKWLLLGTYEKLACVSRAKQPQRKNVSQATYKIFEHNY